MLLIAVFASVAFAQPTASPTFEVASIKAAAPEPQGRVFVGPALGGPGTPDPGHITWANASLQNIVNTAFDVKNFQVTGPAWLTTERFDYALKVPDGATKEQVRVMWQNLLKERFGMVVHHDSKEFQVDELVVGKNGHKLKEAKDPNAPLAEGAPKIENGQLQGPGMFTMIRIDEKGPHATTTANTQPMINLVTLLTSQLGHPVVDKTGLTGKYDFALDFVPNMAGVSLSLPPGAQANGAADTLPDLASAIQSQLGLRLVAGKAKLDVILIDKLEKVPTEN
ncbi:MAG: TIGR03435 family protein [Acidobacteriota bacterium]